MNNIKTTTMFKVCKVLLLMLLSILFVQCGSSSNRPYTRKTKQKVVNLPIPEKKAQFPGGDKELNLFIQNNLKYPKDAQKNKVKGDVVVKFVVDKNGVPHSFEIVWGISHPCNREAIRVLKLMPKWKPGMTHGKAVPSYVTIPIPFNKSKTK